MIEAESLQKQLWTFVRLAEFLSALWEAEYPVEQGDGDRAGVVGPGGRVGRLAGAENLSGCVLKGGGDCVGAVVEAVGAGRVGLLAGAEHLEEAVGAGGNLGSLAGS